MANSAQDAQKRKKLSEDFQHQCDGLKAYYEKSARYAKIGARVVGVVTLVCSVLAPVAVVTTAGSETGLAAFGISGQVVSRVAVVLTILLGLMEGMRRLFQFEERWQTCTVANLEITRLWEVFKRRNASLPIDSDEWMKNYESAHDDIWTIRNSEVKGFFDRVKSTERTKK